MVSITRVNEPVEPVDHVYDFYIMFRGKGKNLEAAFRDAMEQGDLSTIPTPEKAIHAHVPESIFEDLNACGLCAVDNGPEEE